MTKLLLLAHLQLQTNTNDFFDTINQPTDTVIHRAAIIHLSNWANVPKPIGWYLRNRFLRHSFSPTTLTGTRQSPLKLVRMSRTLLQLLFEHAQRKISKMLLFDKKIQKFLFKISYNNERMHGLPERKAFQSSYCSA